MKKSISEPQTPVNCTTSIKPVCSDTNNNKATAYNHEPASNTERNDLQQPTSLTSLDINFNHFEAFNNRGTNVNFNKSNQEILQEIQSCEKLVYGDQFDGNEEILIETESWHKAKNWTTNCSSRKDSLASTCCAVVVAAAAATNSSNTLSIGELYHFIIDYYVISMALKTYGDYREPIARKKWKK